MSVTIAPADWLTGSCLRVGSPGSASGFLCTEACLYRSHKLIIFIMLSLRLVFFFAVSDLCMAPAPLSLVKCHRHLFTSLMTLNFHVLSLGLPFR